MTAAAKDAGVNVVAINMSYSGATLSLSQMASLRELGIRDIVCCNAAGNDSLNNDLANRYASTFVVDKYEKDFTSKTEDGIVTITGTNNYDGKLRYDPDTGNIAPVQ
ncbi:MAG: hypothetical protein IJ857_10420 [Lachnospiraceae bacterium]|nr:hypothetical protein [Lachnospiraceae bacterium]